MKKYIFPSSNIRRITSLYTDQMKHLLTAIACCLAVAGSTQTPVAYNPDADGDGLIGSEDLLVFLTEYGTSFTSLFYTDEAISATYDAESNDWGVQEFAPIYIVDTREAVSDPYYYTLSVNIEANDANGLEPLNGCEFWFITEGPFEDDFLIDIQIAMDCDASLSYVADYGGFSIEDFHSYSESCNSTQRELRLRKFMYLNGEVMAIGH
jgi:hypothetical protein